MQDPSSQLLADILGHPAEDAPRLILADWWEEHGDETDRARGRFVRNQVWLHRSGVPLLVLGRAADRALVGPAFAWWIEAQSLLGAFGRSWLERDLDDLIVSLLPNPDTPSGMTARLLPPKVDATDFGPYPRWADCMQPFGVRWSWERGWPDRLELPWHGWALLAPVLLQAWPVTAVTLTTPPPLVRQRNLLAEDQSWLQGYAVFCLPGAPGRHAVPREPAGPGEEDYVRQRLLRRAWPGIDFDYPRPEAPASE